MAELGVIADWLLTGIRSRAVFPAIVFDRRWHPLDRCDMMSIYNGELMGNGVWPVAEMREDSKKLSS
ncbi:MAG: hypothetical protein AB7G68_18770 [Nitrospiraceae bacterium]